MMAIVSSETVVKGIQANGYTTIQHKFTDHLARVHVTNSRHVDPAFDINADRANRAVKIDKNLKNNEFAQAMKDAKKGYDSIDNVAQYQTNQELLSIIVKYLYSLHPIEAIEYKVLLVRINNLTDPQLEIITGATAAQVRAWLSDLQTIATVINKYD